MTLTVLLGISSLIAFALAFRSALALARSAKAGTLARRPPESSRRASAVPLPRATFAKEEPVELDPPTHPHSKADELREPTTPPVPEPDDPWPPMFAAEEVPVDSLVPASTATPSSPRESFRHDLFADPIDGFQFELGEEVCLCCCGIGYRPESVAWIAETLGGHCVHCGALLEPNPGSRKSHMRV